MSAKEWEEKAKLASNVSAIYTPKDELHQVFTQKGELIRPLELRLTGDISGIHAPLVQCNLHAERLPDKGEYFVYRLLVEQEKSITRKRRPATHRLSVLDYSFASTR
ncbi:hypothetical protein ACOY5P_17745 [Enterobacter asburiae]|uniref:hypothetical protein n=1 Tax=Enterobacter cloacae complex TaxID=354276 RepID=UPI001954FCBF|nr:hypothetical protein [Enterobacter ludwigii]